MTYLCCEARTKRKKGAQCTLGGARKAICVCGFRRHLEPLDVRLGGIKMVETLLLLHGTSRYPGCRENGAKKGPSAELIFK